MRVFEDLCVPEFKEGHRQERKWVHRVMYQRYRRFNVTMVRCVICFKGAYFMHPNTYKLMKDSIK